VFRQAQKAEYRIEYFAVYIRLP